MPHAPPAIRRNCLWFAGFALAALVSFGPASGFAAELRVSWASGNESDLEGYRLRYRTDLGSWSEAIEPGLATSWTLDSPDPDSTYYFEVSSYDHAGNESAPSVEIAARIPANLGPIPQPVQAVDALTHSIYLARAHRQTIRFTGRNLQPGAVISLGPGISVGPTTESITGDLLARVVVDAEAALGPRGVAVWNPDQGIGGASDLIQVVKSPDSNADCYVGLLDLAALAQAWNQKLGEERFTPNADLDGDDYVGPKDLMILAKFLWRSVWECP